MTSSSTATTKDTEAASYVDHFRDPIVDVGPFLERATKTNCLNPTTTYGSLSGGDIKYSRIGMKTSKTPFPVLLYHMLKDSAENSTTHIVCWDRYGRSFRIVDRDAFQDKIMPKYFQSTSYSSFSRQISHYKFQRVTNGTYYHEYFLRGRPDLLRNIVRSFPKPKHSLTSPDKVFRLSESYPTRSERKLRTPKFDQLTPCRELRPAEVVELTSDPILQPRRVFEFSGCAAMIGAPNFGIGNTFNIS